MKVLSQANLPDFYHTAMTNQGDELTLL